MSVLSKGGCDNCEFARVFDELKAPRPKWICSYVFIQHPDGRSHEPVWVDKLFGGASGSATCDEFVERLRASPFAPPLGPPKPPPVVEEPPSEATARALFEALAGAGAGALDAEGMAAGLRRVTGEQGGAMWREFKSALI